MTTSNQNIRTMLAGFVSDELLNGEKIDTDENLLADGVVDSLGMMRLVGFIEESLDYRVPPEDFTIENFYTIDAIAAYLEMRLQSGDQRNG